MNEQTKNELKLTRLLNLMEDRIYNKDFPLEKALLQLLQKYKEVLPPLDGQFHKAFRQEDITDSGYTDMAIWHLLQGSIVFWEIYVELKEEEIKLLDDGDL